MKHKRLRAIFALLIFVTAFTLECPTLNTRADAEAVLTMNEYDAVHTDVQRLLSDNLNMQIRKDLKRTEIAKSVADSYAKKDIEAQQRISEEYNKIQESKPSKSFLGNYELTAYIATGNPCASGAYPTCNHTVACNSLPLGTRIYIEGYGEYVVEDRGGMASNVIDVFVSDYNTAINFGRRTADVYVIE